VSTATLTEAQVITTGRTVLARLNADDFAGPSGKAARRLLGACRDGLAESWDDYQGVKDGQIHPGRIFPELEHDDEAHGTALRKLADDVLAWARVAVLVVRDHCGQETADVLAAAEGGAL
jgi:hypothetical protein